MEVFLGPLDEVVDMQRAFGGQEYVMQDLHVRLTFRFGRRASAVFGATQSTQGAELREGCIFKDFKEFIFVQGIHK